MNDHAELVVKKKKKEERDSPVQSSVRDHLDRRRFCP